MEEVLIFCPYFSIFVFIFPVFAKKKMKRMIR